MLKLRESGILLGASDQFRDLVVSSSICDPSEASYEQVQQDPAEPRTELPGVLWKPAAVSRWIVERSTRGSVNPRGPSEAGQPAAELLCERPSCRLVVYRDGRKGRQHRLQSIWIKRELYLLIRRQND